ncbi:MAG: hypothetical protein SFX73_05775 [Kofleriaceae bacterium]|nr:hypothetical protein [Kofleriaceae bacterium]
MMQLSLLVVALAATACAPTPRGMGGADDDSSGDVDAGTDLGGVGVTSVYAHTSTKLYRVDPESLAITEIGTFGWSNGPDEMTDLAIDKEGRMIGVSFDSVYRVDPTTAAVTRLTANLSGDFNGLSFVPAAMVGGTGDDVLVGTRNTDGMVFRIDPMTGAATAIGNMGSFASSGDLVAVANFTVMTADNGSSSDRLVRLAPTTFAASPIGTNIGYAEIWGVAYWKDKIFGFTSGGQFVTIDPTTGLGTVVQSNGPKWWGAAVTTAAPVLL